MTGVRVQALARFARTLRQQLHRVELPVLVLTMVALAGVWAFAELADAVWEGETPAFDERLLVGLRDPADPARPIGPEWLHELGRDMTALGGVGVLALVTLATVGYLALLNRWQMAGFVFVAIMGGLIMSTVLKAIIDRPRPELVPYLSHVVTASFPSGHSMMSAVTYLTLGALLARLHARRTVKAFLLLGAIAVTLLVGASRVYMGVHWPTDVLAGWAIGAAWATVCWLAALWLQLHGQVERNMRA